MKHILFFIFVYAASLYAPGPVTQKYIYIHAHPEYAHNLQILFKPVAYGEGDIVISITNRKYVSHVYDCHYQNALILLQKEQSFCTSINFKTATTLRAQLEEHDQCFLSQWISLEQAAHYRVALDALHKHLRLEKIPTPTLEQE